MILQRARMIAHVCDGEIHHSTDLHIEENHSLLFVSHVFSLKEFSHGEEGFGRFGLTEFFSLAQRSIKDDDEHPDVFD